jgi:prepilin-type N-terminal cleavage/methylation domain-containing protein
MRKTRYKSGFTLAELLIALMVTSIVLAAVATLAFAMGSANDSAGDIALKQAQIRFATIKIRDLIGNCRMICHLEENNFAIWRADDNGDGCINLDELIYIGSDNNRDYVRIFEFYGDDRVLGIGDIKPLLTEWNDYGCPTYRFNKLIPECENVTLAVYTAPPWSKFASISFDIEENDVSHHYEITAALRAWAGHLIDDNGDFIFSDDDE